MCWQVSRLIQEIRKAIDKEALEEFGQQQQEQQQEQKQQQKQKHEQQQQQPKEEAGDAPDTDRLGRDATTSQLGPKHGDMLGENPLSRATDQQKDSNLCDPSSVNAAAAPSSGQNDHKSTPMFESSTHAGAMDVDEGQILHKQEDSGVSGFLRTSSHGHAMSEEAAHKSEAADGRQASDRQSEFCVGPESQVMKERSEALKAWVASKFSTQSTNEQAGGKGEHGMPGSGWKEKQVSLCFMKMICNVALHVLRPAN